MKALPAPLAVLALLGMTLAGCISGGEAPAPPPAGPADDVGGGTIEGRVADSEVNPLAGARIGIVQLERTTETDAEGAFRFESVPPGTYVVAAEALGYNTMTKNVNVADNATANLTFLLEPLPVEVVAGEPVYETQTFEGFLSCSFSTVYYTFSPCSETCVDEPPVPRQCPGIEGDPNDESEFDFYMQEGVKQIIAEMVWDNSTAVLGSRMVLIIQQCEENCDRWGDPDGDEYIRWQMNNTTREERFNFTGERHLRFLAYADWSIVPVVYWQQRFTLYVTSVYEWAGPHDWSYLDELEDGGA